MGIQEWLSSEQDYGQGLALYEEHGSSNVLKSLFRQGPTFYNQGRLLRELMELCPEPEPVPVPMQDMAIALPILESDAASHLFTHSIRPLLDERRLLHARLEVVTTNAERRELAFEVLEISAHLNPLWQAWDYAREHGHLPTPPSQAEEIPTDGFSLLRKRSNLRSQRSKLRKQPQKAVQLQHVEEQIKKVEEALQNVR